jgi:tetratricopeptide repeat protein
VKEVESSFDMLARYSMVTINRLKPFIVCSTHELVHIWAKERLNDEDKRRFAREALNILFRYVYDDVFSGDLPVSHFVEIVGNVKKFLVRDEVGGVDVCPPKVSGTAEIYEYQRGWRAVWQRLRIWTSYCRLLFSRMVIKLLETFGVSIERYVSNWYLLHRVADRLLSEDLGNVPEVLYSTTLQTAWQTAGIYNLDAMSMAGHIARERYEQYKIAESQECYEWLLELRKVVFGSDHPETLVAVEGIGQIYAMLGRRNEACEMFLTVYEGRRRKLGDVHLLTSKALRLLQACLKDTDRFDEAFGLYKSRMEQLRKTQILGKYKGDQMIELVLDPPQSLWPYIRTLRWMGRCEEIFDILTTAYYILLPTSDRHEQSLLHLHAAFIKNAAHCSLQSTASFSNITNQHLPVLLDKLEKFEATRPQRFRNELRKLIWLSRSEEWIMHDMTIYLLRRYISHLDRTIGAQHSETIHAILFLVLDCMSKGNRACVEVWMHEAHSRLRFMQTIETDGLQACNKAVIGILLFEVEQFEDCLPYLQYIYRKSGIESNVMRNRLAELIGRAYLGLQQYSLAGQYLSQDASRYAVDGPIWYAPAPYLIRRALTQTSNICFALALEEDRYNWLASMELLCDILKQVRQLTKSSYTIKFSLSKSIMPMIELGKGFWLIVTGRQFWQCGLWQDDLWQDDFWHHYLWEDKFLFLQLGVSPNDLLDDHPYYFSKLSPKLVGTTINIPKHTLYTYHSARRAFLDMLAHPQPVIK